MGAILRTMSEPHSDTRRWLEKARWRMAECERALNSLSETEDGRRRQKVIQRMQAYRSLIGGLQERARRDPVRDLEELEGDVAALRNRIREASLALVVARNNYKELRTKWGELVDDVMRERERRGEAPGRVPRIEFDFMPPSPNAPVEERDAYALLRSLDL
jgi:hypothetical protein